MTYLSVPCPYCGSLITDKLECSRCSKKWKSGEDVMLDGICESSRRAAVIVDIVGLSQEYWDAMSLHKRYDTELEKIEVKEYPKRYGHPKYPRSK